MRHTLSIGIRLLWAVFLVLTSAYCLLAYLPYTYYAFVKAPVYAWMPLFASHHVAIYWTLLVATFASCAWDRPGKFRWSGASLLLVVGVVLVFRPVLAQLRNEASSFVFAVIALLLLIFFVIADTAETWAIHEHDFRLAGLRLSSVTIVAILTALFCSVGVYWRMRTQGGAPSAPRWAMLTLWSVVAHLTVALLVASGLNLLNALSARLSRPRTVRFTILAAVAFGAAWWSLSRFIASSFSLQGWLASLYTGLLACALITIFAPLLIETAPAIPTQPSRVSSIVLIAVGVAVALGAPSLIGGNDWNGVLQRSAALALWVVAAVGVFRFPRSSELRVSATVAVLAGAVLVFSSLKFTEIVWAKPLGDTDDEITRSVDAYAELDASFATAHLLLGGSRSEPCDELCRILRQHTNIRSTDDTPGFDLVENLQRTPDQHPNIFIWVVDSLRPDYIGAYNPQATFTPNLDAFARESIAFRNAFTQYAGTTLSEPAIWAGAELLHTHYLHPFDRVNSLQKLARVDGYQLMVSRDTVLDDLFSASDDVIDVEPHKARWNTLEMCETVDSLSKKLDARSDPTRPVMFYSQPMNVHQFGVNDLPRLKDSPGWSTPGFRVTTSFRVHQVDACFGNFISALKQRGLYDNSIIIVSADHGDATGELGRNGHSLVLYPEIMRIPLIVHLPRTLQSSQVYQPESIATLTDIAPTLYYLLGHRELRRNPLFGRSLFARTDQELQATTRRDWFLASDAVAAYGYLADDGRYFYVTYDSPARSYLYDLKSDPQGTHDILTPELKRFYDRRIIEHLNSVANFYHYKPRVESFFAARN